MKLSLCLETIFADRPFVDRMRAASSLGYPAIEFWDWRSKDLASIGEAAARLNLAIAGISGNRQHALIDPDARPGLLVEMGRVFRVAQQMRCSHVMMLSDVLAADCSAVPVPSLSEEEKFENMVDGLRLLDQPAADAGVMLLLEPLNTVLDHRGYFLNSSQVGFEVVRKVDSPRVKLLYDIYHMSMMGEDVMAQIRSHIHEVGYLHVADMPGRHEPGTGKIDYRAIGDWLKQVRFESFIGMEFFPQGSDELAARAAREPFL
jgi:hydroxypyruvate isomerase